MVGTDVYPAFYTVVLVIMDACREIPDVFENYNRPNDSIVYVPFQRRHVAILEGRTLASDGTEPRIFGVMDPKIGEL